MAIGYSMLISFMMLSYDPILAIPTIALVILGIVEQWLDTVET